MFRLFFQNFTCKQFARNCSNFSKKSNFKVAICGGGGKSAQATALMLKTCQMIDELALYDTKCTDGVALDLSHIDTNCKVFSYSGKLEKALEVNSQIVVIMAAAPQHKNADPVDVFEANALIVSRLVSACAQYCPKALLAVATNPVNSIVPLAAGILKKCGTYNPRHLFGITTLDVMRANLFVAECQGISPEKVNVPVIGGHSKNTRIPLLSHTKPDSTFTDDELVCLTKSVQNEPTQLKDNASYLSGAAAVTTFVSSLVRGLRGESNIIECSFVPYDDYPNLGFYGLPIVLGIDGLQKHLGIPDLSEFEYCQFVHSLETLGEDIKLGEDFACNMCVNCKVGVDKAAVTK